MNQKSRSVAARVLRWAWSVVAPAQKAPGTAAESRPSVRLTLRVLDDHRPRARPAEGELDGVIFALGLTILADPYRTFVR